MRLVPASLFGRTLLVLAAGLLLAQAASFALNLFDRGQAVYRLTATQIAARIAQNARILSRLPPAERPKVIESIDGRHLRVMISPQPVQVPGGYEEHGRYETAFLELLRVQLGQPWPLRVEITPAAGSEPPGGPLATWLARRYYFLLPAAFSIVAQVQLEDGSFAVFTAVVPQEPLSRLETLVPQLLLVVVLSFALAALLVYTMTRSLDRMARAADALGAHPDGPPIEETGSSEIRRVIGAFNRMQRRVREHLVERTRLLGAISHDLRTPITRLRLRTEMLADREVGARMQRDLDEMEAMVGSTLEFFRGQEGDPPRLPVDIGALVDSLVEDRRDVGQDIAVSGAAHAPYPGNARTLRRCLDNLVENALRYGGGARITVADGETQLRIAVRDHGPGVPEPDLQRVFEPYVRLDPSRNPASGGVGLGLSVARNIARWHGGDVELANAPGGGLVATVVLPRGPRPEAATAK
ncbi:MAG TPA: ATP-binding protein [Burkholderiales bacterium]|nr:ATP-binding protein [Burkholderiales bacterium]